MSMRNWVASVLMVVGACTWLGCWKSAEKPAAENKPAAPSPTATAPTTPPPASTPVVETKPAVAPPSKPAEPAKPAEEKKPVAETKPAPAKPVTPPPAEDKKPVAETKPATPPATQTKPAVENKPAALAKTEVALKDEKPTTPPAKPKPKRKLMLGDPSLTKGISGSGHLNIIEVQAWLADPANHEPLDFDLPLGLATGRNDVQGLKENPLTRAKIELGRQLYFDGRLSSDGTISCASCHDPREGFAKHTQFGIGVAGQQGGRNSPVSYNRILSSLQFWDGRAATLEEQAKGPIQNPIEMANTHEQAVATLKKIEGYRLQFEKIFGGVTIDGVAQAIASFERAIVTGPTPFDYLVEWEKYAQTDPDDLKDDPELQQKYDLAKRGAETHKMSDSAKRGRDLYFGNKASCSACHVGPNLTDEKYHNIGVGMKAEKPDLGRYVITNNDKERGAFKTPTIRNVALSAPYMHDGSMKTLREVVDFYAKGGEPNPNLDEKIKKLDLTEQDKQDLVAFMEACTGAFPPVERGRLPK